MIKKALLLNAFTFCACFLFGQDLYDDSIIQKIEITFNANNWDQLLDNAYATTEDYILAESVSINGLMFDSVGVKYKGNSTYNSSQVKNPFHIELDTYKDHDYDGFTDIKLSNVAKDPSFLREVLSYQIIRQYMDAPLANYATVYVNGELIGLYTNAEAISKKFVNKYFGSKKNTFIKCNPIEGAGPNSSDFPDLVYLGEDSLNYFEAYELKSDEGWQELINLCDTLSNHTDEVENILDVDRTLWMLALNNALVNLDSYIGGFKQNYYLYKDDKGRFIPIIWDLNESFGRFTMTGSGNLNSTIAKQQMDHLLHENDADFPLIQKLMSIPLYKRMYLAHYKTILKENFENLEYLSTATEYQELIKDEVQKDDNKFFTYNNFIDNLTSDVSGGGGGPGGGATVGIVNLMEGRSEYLLGLDVFTADEPKISEVEISDQTPVINENLFVSAVIENASLVYLGFRSDDEDIFERHLMFDDGLHNDGAAGDNVFGTELLIESAFTDFYVYAENNNIGKFSPQRAEHEYHTITATSSNVVIGDLVINELLASNDLTQADNEGDFDDWIELFNNGTSSIDLGAYFLSDDINDLTKWSFPSGTSIEAGSYLIIWADEDEGTTEIHADFKLSSSGESLFLVNEEGEVVDEVSFAEQTPDISYGRFPNGIGSFIEMSPTFNQANKGTITSVYDPIRANELLDIYPNPAKDVLRVKTKEIVEDLSIYNALGHRIISLKPHSTNFDVNITYLVDGIYIVKASSSKSLSSKQLAVRN